MASLVGRLTVVSHDATSENCVVLALVMNSDAPIIQQ